MRRSNDGLIGLNSVIAAVAAFMTGISAASAQEAYTTRIEPRPFYGATVTKEEGVRVFRPLPPHRQIIINPGQRTPLHLSFNETRTTAAHDDTSYRVDDNGQSHATVTDGADSYSGAVGGPISGPVSGLNGGKSGYGGYHGYKGQRLAAYKPAADNHGVRVNGHLAARVKPAGKASPGEGKRPNLNQAYKATPPMPVVRQQVMHGVTVRRYSGYATGHNAKVNAYGPQVTRGYAPYNMAPYGMVRHSAMAPRMMMPHPRIVAAPVMLGRGYAAHPMAGYGMRGGAMRGGRR
jgi:hypothetical protein